MGDPLVFIEGKRLNLRPLLPEDFNRNFLVWLNDAEINRFSQRRAFPYPEEKIRDYHEYYLANPDKGFVLAAVLKETGEHIGNVALVNIQPVHRCAEVTILIGGGHQGRGYGSEAVYLLTRHSFAHHNLHKIFAGSFNPAFSHMVEKKLGWSREGRFRERIWSDGRYHDQTWSAILQDDFKPMPEFEAAPPSSAPQPKNRKRS